MFATIIQSMQPSFKLWEYKDCVEITNPTQRELIYVVLEGQLALIADDRIFKRTNFEINKTRKKRNKLLQKYEDEGGASKEDIEAILAFETDFPLEIIPKTEYKLVNIVGSTFGNDRIFTGKNFRPSYGISCCRETKILEIPTKVIEDALKKL